MILVRHTPLDAPAEQHCPAAPADSWPHRHGPRGSAGPTYGLIEGEADPGGTWAPDTPVTPVAGLTDHRPIGPSVPLGSVRLLAPVDPGTVLGMAHNTGPGDRQLPAQAFYKPGAGVIGPGESIVVPAGIGRVEPEAELALVIGARCRDLTPAQVPGAVLGWTAANDVTARDLQVSDPLWVRAKSYDTFTPLGPGVRLGMPERDGLVELRADGRLVGSAPLSALARDAVEVLCYLTSFLTLRPGDVVLLGAPAGAADVPLVPGRQIGVRVPGLPELVNPVAAPRGVERLDQSEPTVPG